MKGFKFYFLYTLSTYPKEPVRTEKSSIFNFETVNEVLISGVLGVKGVLQRRKFKKCKS